MAESGKKKKYGWCTDQATLKVKCFESTDDTQILGKLATSPKRTPFHDAELQQATKEINSILARINKTNEDSKRELAFLRVPGGLFLAWTEHAVSSQDDAREINRALGIRAR